MPLPLPESAMIVLNKAAFKLAKLVAAGKLKEAEVREALTKAALACALEPYEIEKTLDSALSAGKRDAEASGGRKTREKAQGRALELPDAVPWEEAVDGAALAHALVADVKRFVVVTDPQADGLALWALHTHALSGTGITPRLAITSPVAGCGKTTLLEWLGSVARRPLESVNISPSATFRTIEAVQPTLLVDEADTLLRENEELRSVLNSGHRVGGSVIRTSGDDFEPRCFSTWSACAIALIGKLPPTLESRSIEIALRRKMRSEVVLRWRSGRAEAAVLARQARRWAIDNVESLKGADPDLPEELFNRSADNWRPLIAIADALGADWPGRARIAAQELSGLAESQSELARDRASRRHPRSLHPAGDRSLRLGGSDRRADRRSGEGLGRVWPLPQADHATPARQAAEALRDRAEEHPDERAGHKERIPTRRRSRTCFPAICPLRGFRSGTSGTSLKNKENLPVFDPAHAASCAASKKAKSLIKSSCAGCAGWEGEKTK